ncbi:GDSL esterase/lipase At1g33811-like [Oryza brachyantha]|uniref:GDSL esterase/lipase At1g33811-like n=1 Tax=Oryza brachyantha TaxID=4533 RepID=UPI001ADC2E3D|nr:GDSL esterase/lipase At1g33811-like [Oryza brachyantha]
MQSTARSSSALVLVLAVAAMAAAAAAAQQLVPCMYIFGDSLVDNGNNNNLLSLARANYRPYGVDFSGGPPGRFTNGLTVVDMLADMLGFRPPLIPAYAAAQPSDLARGLNFASGAAGIRSETGNNLGRHYPLSEQVEHFKAAVRQMGPNASSPERLGRCIFYVGMGSNDYLNNYFMPNYYTTAQSYDPDAYAADLLQEYSRQLAALHALGARKFAVAGVGEIGCIPYELARINTQQGGGGGSGTAPPATAGTGVSISLGGVGLTIGGGGGAPANASMSSSRTGGVCNDEINSAIAIYNRGLLAMVKRFNRGQKLPGSTFVFLDTVRAGRALVAGAAAHGFTVLDRGCCGVGRNNGQITCLPMQQPCDDRSKYVFWDAFHPTEAANRIYAAMAFNSTSAADAYPINIRQLAAI